MTDTRWTASDLLAAAGVVVIWGTNFVAMKIGLEVFTPFQMGAARYLFGMLPLVLLVRRPAMPWKWILAFGLAQGVGQFGLLFTSLRVGMTASLASVLMQTQVFFTVLLSLVLLSERPGRHLLAGMAIAAMGLGCFAAAYAGTDGSAAAGTTALGFVLCLGAASMWASSNLVVRFAQKAAPGFDPFGFIVWCSAVPVLPFVAMTLAFDAPEARWRWLEAGWPHWAAAAYLGWFASVLAYTLWTRLIKRHGANRVAPFSLGVPVVGIACGTLLLGEGVSAWQWAGIGLTVTALAVVMLGPMVAAWWAGRWQ